MLYYKKVNKIKGKLMEWISILTIDLPVVLALGIGFFYNNSRLNDVNKRFDEVHRSGY